MPARAPWQPPVLQPALERMGTTSREKLGVSARAVAARRATAARRGKMLWFMESRPRDGTERNVQKSSLRNFVGLRSASRGCPCHLAGRSLRPSWPPFTQETLTPQSLLRSIFYAARSPRASPPPPEIPRWTQKSSEMGAVPKSARGKGRPAGPGRRVVWSRPREWKMVATMSPGTTGRSAGKPPMVSLFPTTLPP